MEDDLRVMSVATCVCDRRVAPCTVVVRTCHGVGVAKKLAAFVLETDEVHLSVSLESVMSRRERIRWVAQLRMRARKRRGKVAEAPLVLHDYIFSTHVGRRVVLPEPEVPLAVRASMSRASRPPPRPRHTLRTLVDWLKDGGAGPIE